MLQVIQSMYMDLLSYRGERPQIGCAGWSGVYNRNLAKGGRIEMAFREWALSRRKWMTALGAGAALVGRARAQFQIPTPPSGKNMTGIEPDQLLLKDYRPKSLFKVPQTEITKAKYPVIDVHCHGIRPADQMDRYIRLMDRAGVEKTVIFTGANNAERFTQVKSAYAKYAGRFDFWCTLDFTGSDDAGFGPNAVKALEECHRAGATGVGELSDKGMGLGRSVGDGPPGWPGGSVQSKTMGPHADDPRLDAVWEKCAQLGMPVNMHVSNIIWVYYPQDYQNDGLMNEFVWRLDNKPGILGHDGLIQSMERMVARHAKTTFIFCHFANLDYDFTRLSGLLDKYPNMFVDNAAQYAETAATPRAAAAFYQKYADRILYGTDMPYHERMFGTTFRILESLDEHFYEQDLYFNFNYHWPMHGFGLPDDVLRKVYSENAKRVFEKAKTGAA